MPATRCCGIPRAASAIRWCAIAARWPAPSRTRTRLLTGRRRCWRCGADVVATGPNGERCIPHRRAVHRDSDDVAGYRRAGHRDPRARFLGSLGRRVRKTRTQSRRLRRHRRRGAGRARRRRAIIARLASACATPRRPAQGHRRRSVPDAASRLLRTTSTRPPGWPWRHPTRSRTIAGRSTTSAPWCAS